MTMTSGTIRFLGGLWHNYKFTLSTSVGFLLLGVVLLSAGLLTDSRATAQLGLVTLTATLISLLSILMLNGHE